MNALRDWRTALPLCLPACVAICIPLLALWAPASWTGDPLADWPTYKPEAGDFRIRFPIMPTTSLAEDYRGDDRIGVRIFTAESDGRTYSVHARAYPLVNRGSVISPRLLDWERDRLVVDLRGRTTGEMATTFRQYPARDLTVSLANDTQRLHGRLILVSHCVMHGVLPADTDPCDATVYWLTVTGPVDDTELAERAGHYFNLFQRGTDGP